MALILNKKYVFQIIFNNLVRLRKLGVNRIGLFGSYARGEQKADSDIDLLVEFAPGEKTFDAFMQLAFLLEELLEHPVELVTVESLSPYLKPHILKEVEFAAHAA